MTKYRKRPVVVNAVRWDGTVEDATVVINWILTQGGTARYHEADAIVPDMPGLAIDTLEGTMWANPHDWIIQGIKGEFYPCKSDIFEATYEPAEDH